MDFDQHQGANDIALDDDAKPLPDRKAGSATAGYPAAISAVGMAAGVFVGSVSYLLRASIKR